MSDTEMKPPKISGTARMLVLNYGLASSIANSPDLVGTAQSLIAFIAELEEDGHRLNYLDELVRFAVGTNEHDGRQSTEDDTGRHVILRLWHESRGGDNQSLRTAIDASKPKSALDE